MPDSVGLNVVRRLISLLRRRPRSAPRSTVSAASPPGSRSTARRCPEFDRFARSWRRSRSNATLACYVAALDPTSFAPGSGGSSMVASGAAAWANLRVEGLAIDQYAKKTLKFHPDAATLAKAQDVTRERTERRVGECADAPCTGNARAGAGRDADRDAQLRGPRPGGVARPRRQARHDDPADDGVDEEVLRLAHRGLRHDLRERRRRRSDASSRRSPRPRPRA